MEERCEKCRWCYHEFEAPINDMSNGRDEYYCHKNAPEGLIGWPRVQKDYWCGEYVAKPKVRI
jgi:hypothetical protein